VLAKLDDIICSKWNIFSFRQSVSEIHPMPLDSIFSLSLILFSDKTNPKCKTSTFVLSPFCQQTMAAVCLCSLLLIFLLLLRYFTMSTLLCLKIHQPFDPSSVCMPIQANWHPMVISHDVARGPKFTMTFASTTSRL